MTTRRDLLYLVATTPVFLSGCTQMTTQIRTRSLYWEDEMVAAKVRIGRDGSRWDAHSERVKVDITFLKDDGSVLLDPDKAPVVVLEKNEEKTVYVWYDCDGEVADFTVSINPTTDKSQAEVFVDCDKGN